MYIRSITITPMQTTFHYENINDSNRILRKYDEDKFMRVSFREEEEERFQKEATRNTERVYDYFRKIMLDGVYAGNRKYFFLVMTTSQMSSHNAWFVCTYFLEETNSEESSNDSNNLEECNKKALQPFSGGNLIGADSIKSWIGEFKQIKCIGKYAVRIGQAFSATKEGIPMENTFVIKDTERNGFVFTDGVGIISRTSAQKLSTKVNFNKQSSAFQIRFGGAKGVITVQPESVIRYIVEKHKLPVKNLKEILILRNSMVKFKSAHDVIEVCTETKSHEFYLNRQIIMILEAMGIPIATFTKLQDEYLKSIVHEALSDGLNFINKHCVIQLNSFTNRMLYSTMNYLLEEVNQKSRILVKNGRTAMGVTDEMRILEEDDVFLCFNCASNDNNKSNITNSTKVRIYGDYAVPTGIAIVAKNPCMHPGDIRIVKCVDVPELHYMKEVLVFSQKGSRPIFNQCSGSDLDGDIYSISWNDLIIPHKTFESYNYLSNLRAFTKENILRKDIVNFFIKHMKTHQLGIIAISHQAHADKDGVCSDKALQLSQLFNRSIDFVKTGSSASISADLIPQEYPDFMEMAPAYYSNKALGHLYRRSKFKQQFNSCECKECYFDVLDQMTSVNKIVLKGSGAYVLNDTSSYGPMNEMSQNLQNEYRTDIRLLLNKFNINTEEELYLNKDIDVIRELKNIVQKYRTLAGSIGNFTLGACSKDSGMFSLIVKNSKTSTFKKEEIEGDRKRTVRGGQKNKDVLLYNMNVCEFNRNIYIEHKEYVIDKNNENKEQNKVKNNNDLDSNSSTENDHTDHLTSSPTKKSKVTDSSINNDFTTKYNMIDNTYIKVYADYNRMLYLFNNLNEYRRKIFKETFNLMILTGIHSMDEIDRVVNVLLLINEEMTQKEKNHKQFSTIYSTISGFLEEYFMFLNVCFGMSNDALFKIAFVVGVELSIHKKIGMTREMGLRSGCVVRYGSVCKERDMIVHGMLDGEDELDFIQCDNNNLSVKLKNKGFCDFAYYHDDVKEFVLNLLYTPNNYQIIKQYRHQVMYTIKFKVGEVLFSGVDEKIVQSKMKVRDLVKEIDAKRIQYNLIYNKKESLNSENISKVYTVRKNNSALQLESDVFYVYTNIFNKVSYITQAKEKMGEMLIVNRNNGYVEEKIKDLNERDDCVVELHREKIVFDHNEMKKSRDVREILLLVENVQKDTSFKIISITDRIISANQRFMFDKNKEENYYCTQWVSDVDNLSKFSENFKELWDVYIK